MDLVDRPIDPYGRGNHPGKAMQIRVLAVILILILTACSDEDSGQTAPVSLVTTAAPATTAAPTTTQSTTTTTVQTTTGTTERPKEPELPLPAAVEQHAQAYCASWPAIDGLLSEDATFATVSSDGWNADTDQVIRGRSAVSAALAEFSAVECGELTTIAGDWIALPISAHRTDGTGLEGIWVLRAGNELISWHLSFATETEPVSSPPTEIDQVIEAESRAYCEIFEIPDERGVETVLSLMSDDPAMYAIPLGYDYAGVEGVTLFMSQTLRSDVITCLEGSITNGMWSAGGSTLENPEIGLSLIGMNVMLHTDGRIHQHFANFTQVTGSTTFGLWGLPLEDD
jgi:hypothetical protein